MNSFERHGITHLSASSLNSYIAAPALWVMERLLGKRAPVGCSAHRGTAVEGGVSMGLFDPSANVETCQQAALASYDRLTALSSDHRRESEREGIPGMVEQGLRELRQYGVPDRPCQGHQEKSETQLEGCHVPLIGFLDFAWSKHGILLDTKTSTKLVSEISASHKRQVAGYVHARQNWQGRVTYITPKKLATYILEREDYEEGIRQMTGAARSLGKLLAVSDDPQEIAALFWPDLDHFYWSSATAKAYAREVWA